MKKPNDTNELGNNEPAEERFIHPECVGTERLKISPAVPNNFRELLERQSRNKSRAKNNAEISTTSKEILESLKQKKTGPKEDIELASILTKRLLSFYSGVVDKLINYDGIEKEIIVTLARDTDRLALACQILSNITISSLEEEEEEEG